MKKLICGLIFGLLLLTATSSKVLAKDPVTPSPETTSPATEAAKVDYLLPYPGILPDHVLYPVKMLRDRIMDLLIKDPVSKTEFLILMADKRLGASKALIEGNKTDLGVTTLWKDEAYLNRAVLQASLAIKEEKNINGTLDKLENSSLKHIEVMGELLANAPETAKPGIKTVLDKVQKDYQQVLEIRR